MFEEWKEKELKECTTMKQCKTCIHFKKND